MHRAADVPWLGASLGTCLIGALIADLAARGRLVVQCSADPRQPAIRLIDGSATGDELLDDTLAALAASRPSGSRGGWWFMGALDRRRIRTRGSVQRDDLVSWWNGYWTTSQIPQVTPTLLAQLLAVHQRVNTIMKRVNERLQDRGLLVAEAGRCRRAERGDRWCQGFVDDRARDRVFAQWQPPAAGYVAALDVRGLASLKDELAGQPVAIADDQRVLGAAVSQIASAWQERFV